MCQGLPKCVDIEGVVQLLLVLESAMPLYGECTHLAEIKLSELKE